MNGTLQELVKEEMERRMELLRQSNKEVKVAEEALFKAKKQHSVNAEGVAELIDASGKEKYLYGNARYWVTAKTPTQQYLEWEDATGRGADGGSIQLPKGFTI